MHKLTDTRRRFLGGVIMTISVPLGARGLIRSPGHLLVGEPRALPVEGSLASFAGATGWLNTEPLTPEGLRGRVVLVDFWTSTCVNWIRTLPYVRAWAAFALRGAGGLVAVQFAWLVARFHRHAPGHSMPWWHVLRTVSPSVVAAAICVVKTLAGLRLVLRSTDDGAWRDLGLVVVGLFVFGNVRAWVLLGDPRYRWSGWLNPLQVPVAPQEGPDPLPIPSPTT